MKNNLYNVCDTNLLHEPEKYHYSAYEGIEYIKSWLVVRSNLNSRTDGRTKHKINSISEPTNYILKENENLVDTRCLLNKLNDLTSEEASKWINWYIKRFEVRKKIFERYIICDGRIKPIGSYQSLSLYLLFIECLLRQYSESDDLSALNAAIKCLDTVTSTRLSLNDSEQDILKELIRGEKKSVEKLILKRLNLKKQKIDKKDGEYIIDVSRLRESNKSKLVFIAADTIRSRGYAQVLIQKGIKLKSVLIMQNGKSPEYKSSKYLSRIVPSEYDGYFIPSLDENLLDTCKNLTNDLTIQTTETINTEQTTSWVASREANYAIYSGFPGQIVKPEIINGLPPLIHMHAGLLPEFRGSTTSFYSSLLNGNSGVTSILLSEHIDNGPKITSRLYPEPTLNIEYDHLHDSIIRSDLLIRTLSKMSPSFEFAELKPQTGVTRDFYVIHPILKHVALMCASGEGYTLLEVLESFGI